MKFWRVLCVLAVATCLTVVAYAETQNIKLSGDLTVRGILRDQYDYNSKVNNGPGAVTRTQNDSSPTQGVFMSVVGLRVDADLTDNVSTVVRILNQRDWNNVQTKAVNANTPLAMNGLGGYTYNPDEFQVAVDLAYVTLKDFIYSPLTLSIGRQDLWFGKGFIVGLNMQSPTASLSAPEYTDINSFDSIKAVLDYDPWKITGIFSNIHANYNRPVNGTHLWGVDVGYMFNKYKADAEAYWFFKRDALVESWSDIKGAANDVHTLGIRGSVDPIDVLTLNAEAAMQVGSYVGNQRQVNIRPRMAGAVDVSAESRYLTDKFAWKPKISGEYIFYSGNPPEDSAATVAGTFTGWDPMYRGKFDSAIREFVGKFYTTACYPIRQDQLISSPDASFTNQHQFVLAGSLQPIESLLVKGNVNFFFNAYGYVLSGDPPGKYVGTEIDLNADWDYTEDVSFGILAGWFMPGTAYYDNLDKVASDVVGTVKVSF
jgi:hypothetical protein